MEGWQRRNGDLQKKGLEIWQRGGALGLQEKAQNPGFRTRGWGC